MTEIDLSPELIRAAAARAGIPRGLPLAELARRVLEGAAAADAPRRIAVADGGSEPKRAGTRWETTVTDHARDRGFDWDRAPLRGRRDLLDLTGTIPDGWLIGAKALSRTASESQKLSGAMDQSSRAMANLRQRKFAVDTADVIPVQILQRSGAGVGRAYAVTEFDAFLQLAELRRNGWKPLGE